MCYYYKRKNGSRFNRFYKKDFGLNHLIIPYVLIHRNDSVIANSPHACELYDHAPNSKFDTANITNPHLLYLLFDATIIAARTDIADPLYSRMSSNLCNFSN